MVSGVEMLSRLMALTGVIVLLVTAVDILATSATVSEPGGNLTRRYGDRMWAFGRALFGGRHVALQRYGLLVVYSILLLWLVITWAGWVLVFTGVGRVEQAATGIPATLWQTIYYTGITITSLGEGKFVAASGVGQAATVLCALNGLVLLSLTVAWLIPVLGAVSAKRQLAAMIAGLGDTPQQVKASLFGDNAGFGADSFLIDLAGRLEQTTQHHFSYPVLHYFHSREMRTALSPNVARLDEALMLMLNTAPPSADLSPALPLMLRMSKGLLDAMKDTFIEPAAAAPAIPRPSDDELAIPQEIGWE